MIKEKTINVRVTECHLDDLSASDRALVEEARRATRRAYAPYSHFHVGAALRLDNGEVVTGANQENAAFPSGTCAERTACYYAHARYPQAQFDTIAIAAADDDGVEPSNPISPCGACRQALLEYETLKGSGVRVLLAGRDGLVQCVGSIRDLLPLAFTEF